MNWKEHRLQMIWEIKRSETVDTKLEQEMTLYNQRIQHIVKQGEAMAKAGHFDSGRILKNVKDFPRRFDSLQQPAARRRTQLEESRKFHQYMFDVDLELQWIAERRPIAASADCGQSLTDATNLHKKHEQLKSEVSGHEPLLKETLDKGEQLLNEKHFASNEIKAKTANLNDAWMELLSLVKQRRRALDLALKQTTTIFI